MSTGDGAAVILLSIIGTITTILPYALVPLPIAWKKRKYVNEVESPYPSHFAVDFPALLILPSFCYNIWGIVNVLAMSLLNEIAPVHYICLQLSHMIGTVSLVVYGYIFIMTQHMRCGGPPLLQHFLFILSALLPFAGLIMLLFFLNITETKMFTGILYTVLGIIMYASPLPILMNNRKVNTVQYFAMWLSVSFFFNAFSWFLVTLIASPYDPYLLITNVVGAILGLVHFGIILNSACSTEIPRILKCWISLVRERGLDSTVNETATKPEPNETVTKPGPNDETAASERNDLCV